MGINDFCTQNNISDIKTNLLAAIEGDTAVGAFGAKAEAHKRPRASAFVLPTDKAKTKASNAQGWAFETEVKMSGIPNAGHGRYAKETVKAGAVVCMKSVRRFDPQNAAASYP